MDPRGDLSQMGISRLLPELMKTGEDALLFFSSSWGERKLWLHGLEIRLVAMKGPSASTLEELLVMCGHLTALQLKSAQDQVARQPGSDLGETLLREGWITQEQVDGHSRAYLVEVLADLWRWEQGTYAASPVGSGGALAEADPAWKNWTFTLEEIKIAGEECRRAWQELPEAVRREEEIFEVSERAAWSRYLEEEMGDRCYPGTMVSGKVLSSLVGLADGRYNLRTLVETTRFPPHVVALALADAARRSWVVARSDEALESNGARALQEEDFSRAEPSYRLLLARHPGEGRLTLIYADLEERLGRRREAAERLKRLARKFRDEHNLIEAKRLGERVFALSPHDEEAMEHLYLVYREMGDQRAGIEMAKILARGAQRKGNFARAEARYRECLQFVPKDAAVRGHLAGVLARAGKKAEALAEYLVVEQALAGEGAVGELAAVYRKILQLEPGDPRARARLAELEKKDPTLAVRRPGAGRRRIGYAAGALFLVLIFAGTVIFWPEGPPARRDGIPSRPGPENVSPVPPGSARGGKKNPVPVAAPSAHRVPPSVSGRPQVRVASVSAQRHLARYLAGRKAERRMDWNLATYCYRRAASLAVVPVVAAMAREEIGRLQPQLARLEAELARGGKLERQGEWREARDCYQKLGTRPEGRRIMRWRRAALPMWLETVPSGAELRQDGERIGLTPLLVRVPFTGTTWVLTCPGCEPRTYRPTLKEGETLILPLYRKPVWRLDTGASLQAEPGVEEGVGPDGGAIYAGNRRGQVWKVRSGDGHSIWDVSLGNLEDITGGLLVAADAVWVPTRSGNVHALKKEDGKSLGRVVLGGRFRGPPVGDRENSRVMFLTEEGAVYGLDPVRRAPVWKFSLAGPGYDRLHPWGENWLALTPGEVLEFEAVQGRPVRRHPLSTPALALADCYPEGVLLVLGQNGRLQAIGWKEQRERWLTSLGEMLYGSLAGGGGMAWIGNDRGQVTALSLDQGLRRWSRTWPGVGVATPLVEKDGLLFWGGKDNAVHAMRTDTGKWLWQISTGGQVKAAPVVAGPMLVAGADDGFLYAVPWRE